MSHLNIFQRFARLLVCSVTMFALVSSFSINKATAIDFDTDSSGGVLAPGSQGNPCPTLTAEPEAFEGWFNLDDMERRGYLDPKNQKSWGFANKIGQLICGAKAGAKIYIGMYFFRALGGGDRPETDTQVIWNAMRWVKNNRKVQINVVLEGNDIHSSVAKRRILKALKGVATVYWCRNGCMNVNKASESVWALNHEKFMAISNTIWGEGYNSNKSVNPAVYTSSGNFARSQIRTYWQEGTLFYDDMKLYSQFAQRFQDMRKCGSRSSSPGASSKCSFGKSSSLRKQRNIWVDTKYRHNTDSGRGTTVSFSPQPADSPDYFVSQFNGVDCSVDNRIRVAMFRLTAVQTDGFIKAVKGLVKRGCDVRVLLSQQGGAWKLSKSVARAINKAHIPVSCSAVQMHTKLILIGPSSGGSGRVLVGTANATKPGMYLSDEHVITVDSRKATGIYKGSAEKFYGTLLSGWDGLNQGSVACK